MPFLRFFLLYISVISILSTSMAQNLPFGEVPDHQLNMTSYSKDTSAGAVILNDYGEVDFRYNNCSFTCSQRIKIFKKEYAYMASKAITVHIGQNLIGLEAASYNIENGKVVKTSLTKELIHKASEKDRDIVKFSIPNVKEGSIVEYKYTLLSQQSIRLPNWYFQSQVPVKWSELKFLNMPISFGSELQSWFPLDTIESYKKNGNYRWVMKDLPAFKRENFMANEWENLSRIIFFFDPPESIEAGWKEMVRSLKNRDFIRNPNVKFLRPYVESFSQQHKDSLGLMVACYNFIKENVHCKEAKNIECRPLKKVFDEKAGSAAEINLMLCSMLREAGFESYPVALSTKEYGILSKNSYPSKYNFNYIACYIRVGHKNYFLDATEETRPYFIPSASILNCVGLVLDKSEINWVTITPENSQSAVNWNFLLQLDSTGVITGNARVTFKGYAAFSTRETMKNSEEDYIKILKSRMPFAELSEIKIKNKLNIEKNLVMHFKIRFEDAIDITANKLLINPFLVHMYQTHPMIKPERYYPIEFETPIEHNFTLSLGFPEQFRIASAPQNMQLNNEDASIGFTYLQDISPLNLATIKSRFYVKDCFYPASMYAPIREIITKMIEKEKEDILLTKK